MGRSYAEIAFTPLVKNQQTIHGSRAAYLRLEQRGEADRISEDEIAFIAARESLYMASTSETGWPYIQHRGGERGFVRVLDEQTLAFVDFCGNKQYVSVGNLQYDSRVALFFMEYANRARLKVLGRAEIHEGAAAADLIERLRSGEDKTPIERVFVVHIEGLDWNCSQHITPRFTEQEVMAIASAMRQRVEELEAENTRLRSLLENDPRT